MSAHDPDIIRAHNEGFDQGESFGRHVARQELLPLLKEAADQLDVAQSIVDRRRDSDDLAETMMAIRAAIADIETT
jgi:hypothetical protein